MPVLTQFGKHNLVELFTVEIKKQMPDASHYTDFITEVFVAVSGTMIAKESLISSGVVNIWIDHCMI